MDKELTAHFLESQSSLNAHLLFANVTAVFP